MRYKIQYTMFGEKIYINEEKTWDAWYNKNRLGGKSRFSGVSRLSCYYRVNSSVFIGL